LQTGVFRGDAGTRSSDGDGQVRAESDVRARDDPELEDLGEISGPLGGTGRDGAVVNPAGWLDVEQRGWRSCCPTAVLSSRSSPRRRATHRGSAKRRRDGKSDGGAVDRQQGKNEGRCSGPHRYDGLLYPYFFGADSS